jgi:protocatechuate 3,4-dioxygenase, beta subunit
MEKYKMNRRNLIKMGATAAVSILAIEKAFALTPSQPKGPFYPIVDQVDKDSDLIYVAGSTISARGEIVIIEGIVTDQKSRPVAGVLVEIWQACETGKYNHPSDPNKAELDPHFQYWGKAVTDKNGFYRFRTIVPGAYPADTNWIRPPHIHFKVAKLGYVELITQMYFSGNEFNSQDLILKRLSPDQQKEVIVELKKMSDVAHPVGQFNIQIEKI